MKKFYKTTELKLEIFQAVLLISLNGNHSKELILAYILLEKQESVLINNRK